MAPVSRSVYDYALRSPLLDTLFEALADRQLIRNISRPGHPPNYAEMEESLGSLLRKLISQGMAPEDEDKLLVRSRYTTKYYFKNEDNVTARL